MVKMQTINDFVIIGSGIAGLSAASWLQAHGKQVLILDKARNPGGRLSTRQHTPYEFDHGAQFFTARDKSFQKLAEQACLSGTLTTFQHPEKGQVYGGNPVFSHWVAQMSSQLSIQQNATVTKIQKIQNQWFVKLADGAEIKANNLIITLPAPQTELLLTDTDDILDSQSLLIELKATTKQASYHPCLAAMIGISLPIQTPHLAVNEGENLPIEPLIMINEGAIGWAIAKFTNDKESQSSIMSVLIHATPEYSHKNLESDAGDIAEALWAEWKIKAPSLYPDLNKESFIITNASYLRGHKWRYARVKQSAPAHALRASPQDNIALAGDWLEGPRLESAWLSGQAAAKSLL